MNSEEVIDLNTQIKKYIGDFTLFLDNLINGLKGKGLSFDELSKFPLDHICYRCSSNREYIDMKSRLETLLGIKLLTESTIGGRLISVYHFEVSLTYKEWEISCLELADIKIGSVYESGIEHAEFVIGDSMSNMFNSKHLLENFISRYPTITFDLSGISKEINADVRIKISSSISAKFHAQSLYDVVLYELANQ